MAGGLLECQHFSRHSIKQTVSVGPLLIRKWRQASYKHVTPLPPGSGVRIPCCPGYHTVNDMQIILRA